MRKGTGSSLQRTLWTTTSSFHVATRRTGRRPTEVLDDRVEALAQRLTAVMVNRSASSTHCDNQLDGSTAFRGLEANHGPSSRSWASATGEWSGSVTGGARTRRRRNHLGDTHDILSSPPVWFLIGLRPPIGDRGRECDIRKVAGSRTLKRR